ncbi:hypothetical protein [Pseudobacillus badius]|uniref:hypothetical protein n=1 Tax=Bacillus badius TaxID=1455 RepID=UPI0007B393C8|nr:hypothetical protein [Bacillus badius]KZR57891.1 hypothetical protein A3781_19130 [Bacillus badius]
MRLNKEMLSEIFGIYDIITEGESELQDFMGEQKEVRQVKIEEESSEGYTFTLLVIDGEISSVTHDMTEIHFFNRELLLRTMSLIAHDYDFADSEVSV